MKLHLGICGALCSALLLVGTAAAKQAVLQIVDLTELGRATEGGEATLYRVLHAKRAVCKIEVVHFGETGKAIYVFGFGKKLYDAERREYRYRVPIHASSKVQPVLTNRITLGSKKGRDALSKEFEEYRSLFEARHLARCSGN